MDDVTSFRIEKGSCLESIDPFGLTGMSYLNENEGDRKGILVLPSKVTSIAENGIYDNNLIKTIYYCGSTHLSNYSDLENGVSEPDIKVTSSYTYETIFGNYTPKKDSSSIADAEEKCKSYGFIPKASPSPSPLPTPSPSPSPSPYPSPTASFQPTASYSGRGRPNSLLSWMARIGRQGIGSLRRGELQTGEPDSVEFE